MGIANAPMVTNATIFGATVLHAIPIDARTIRLTRQQARDPQIYREAVRQAGGDPGRWKSSKSRQRPEAAPVSAILRGWAALLLPRPFLHATGSG